MLHTRFGRGVIAIVFALGAAACNASTTTPDTTTHPTVTPGLASAEAGRELANSTPIPSPTSRLSPAAADTPHPALPLTPTPTQPPWEILAPGFAVRHIRVSLAEVPPSTIYAIRIDPDQVDFQVHWNPETPHSIEEWQAITGAWMIFNGGFFTGGNAPVGRLIVDGEMFGSQVIYDDSIGIGGLFAVLDGVVTLRALGRQPFGPNGMRYDQGVECYPMLLLPGGQPAYPVDTGERARRTVIALDDQGYVVLLLSDLPVFTLHELSHWLARSDLRLDSALNLDGGRSSGMVVSLPGNSADVLPAYVPLPIVIAVYPRE